MRAPPGLSDRLGEGSERFASGKLAANVMHFGRLLRAAGLPVGPAHLLTAVDTVTAVGVTRREDVFWALHAAFVKRRDEEVIFREAFELFWQDPYGRADTLALLLPQSQVPEDEERDAMSRRLQEAWRPPPPRSKDDPLPEEQHELDGSLTWSDVEAFRKKDFDDMSADEIRRARHLIRRMKLPHLAVPTRRLAARARGVRLDVRRMLRDGLRSGGRDLPLRFRGRTVRPPPLVVLCDISGSMERYSRMFLHFLHALTSDRDRVTSFVFGTRLTNITRWLRSRDVDHALARIGTEVGDWSGGTRIETCLRVFNQQWSRRVLGQGAVVLLVTDGLDRGPSLGEPLEDRGDPADSPLGREARRLQRSCRRLVWLNPLLRFEGFEPLAAGVKAILPHVDDHRPVHDLASLEQLVSALEAPPRPKRL